MENTKRENENMEFGTEIELVAGAAEFERFWLRPGTYQATNKTVVLRLKINKRWSGWRLKDELIESLDLNVGDTISTEVTPGYMTDLIDEDGTMDLFASGESADWLLDNNVRAGTIIDCRVRFVYAPAPVGYRDKEVYKLSLVMVGKGIAVVKESENKPGWDDYGFKPDFKPDDDDFPAFLKRMSM